MLRTFKLLLPLALIAATGVGDEVRYNRAGELIVPANYRDWVFLTSGLNMNYGDEAIGAHDTFDNVFVDPKSWRAFKATGHWPEGTVFAKEGRRGSTKGSINQSGQFQTEQRLSRASHSGPETLSIGLGLFRGRWKQACARAPDFGKLLFVSSTKRGHANDVCPILSDSEAYRRQGEQLRCQPVGRSAR